MALFQIWNGPSPTTAKFAAVTTGTAIKTMLQVKPSATLGLAKIIEWGIKCDAPASACLFVAELVETDVAATVTAHVAAGIVKFDAQGLATGDPTTNIFQVGTTSTGYTSGGEGSIGTSRVLDQILTTIPSTNGYEYVKQFPLGREPVLNLSGFGRIIVHTSVAVNAICYVTIDI